MCAARMRRPLITHVLDARALDSTTGVRRRGHEGKFKKFVIFEVTNWVKPGCRVVKGAAGFIKC